MIENPIQFTIVNADPLESSGAFPATSVENIGESAMTTSPQKNKNMINKTTDSDDKKNGEVKQHKQDKKSDIVAIFLAPNRVENNPLKTQAMAPDPMIKNESNGTFKFKFE